MKNMDSKIDLDKIVDYRAEYTSAIAKYKICGDELTGLCPFHDDKNPSFSANLKTGQWFCHAEGIRGNFVDFWAKLNATDTQTAYLQILQKYNVESGKVKKAEKSKKNS